MLCREYESRWGLCGRSLIAREYESHRLQILEIATTSYHVEYIEHVHYNELFIPCSDFDACCPMFLISIESALLVCFLFPCPNRNWYIHNFLLLIWRTWPYPTSMKVCHPHKKLDCPSCLGTFFGTQGNCSDPYRTFLNGGPLNESKRSPSGDVRFYCHGTESWPFFGQKSFILDTGSFMVDCRESLA